MRDVETVEIGHPGGVKENMVYMRSSIVSKNLNPTHPFHSLSDGFMSNLTVLVLLLDCTTEMWRGLMAGFPQLFQITVTFL